MIILKGDNLGERQRELNKIVKEAAAKRLDFQEIKAAPEKSDVDKLFKIDLASKYLNIEYIIEILKSGDSLYISRALKCTWIFDDNYADIINANYLHSNVMPFMSTKMKKKLLTTISINIRNEDRAAEFYNYCMKIKYTSIAQKFLNFTSDAFKLALLNDKEKCHHLVSGASSEYLKHFIGLSFTLADAYVEIIPEYNRIQLFRELGYLYSISDVKYLDLLQKPIHTSPYNNCRLGLRISKSIMKQHKDKVLENPSLFIKILNNSAVVKYSIEADAKVYLKALLPDDVTSFWDENFCNTYKFILDKIMVGKYIFLKEIFTEKYPKQEFEMNIKFYDKQYYKFMTAEERETWALSHIASQTEILGIGRDYNWYKFVSFEKALEEIKKIVMITPDSAKRADIINILIESAKNQRDVEKLLKHYYERHVNEPKYNKENFIDNILQYFDVFQFDDDCWAAWNKIMYNLEVYSTTDSYNCKGEYKLIAFIHHVIKQKEVPKALQMYIHSEMYFYSLKLYTDKLPKEQQEMVYNHLFECYMGEIRKHENEPYNDEVRYRLRKYIHFMLDLLVQYDRTKEDCPEVLNKFIQLDLEEFRCHSLLHAPATCQITKVDLMRHLKKDVNLLIENLPHLKINIESYTSYTCHISTVLKKLKVYFSDDIAKDFLTFFDELLREQQLWHKIAQTAAHGIFILGDEPFKIDFMTKYAPKEPKINHSEIDENLLRIQQAICAHACYSRPPLPLKHILMYIKGDYVQYCLPMFQSFLANLPMPLCMEFIEAILNTPISVQKHGIRLAFECFNAESLNRLVLGVWKKTKNVSLRMVIFKAIYNKISEVVTAQEKLFETLKTITSTLREDDDEEVFGLLVPRTLPRHFIPEYIEVAWNLVSKLPPRPTNIKRMQSVIKFMSNNINTIRQDIVREIIDSFIVTVFAQEEGDTAKQSSEMAALIEAKWNLTASYIICIKDKDDLANKIDAVRLLLKELTVPLEAGIRDNKYYRRQICFKFINNILRKGFLPDFHRYENMNALMQFVLKSLQDALSIEEIYLLVWEIRLGIISRKVLADAKMKLEETDKREIKDIALNLAKELGNLIKEFVEKEMYYTTFSNVIADKISNHIETVKNLYDVKTDIKDMMIIVSIGLMEFEISPVYLLVLNFLSAGCSTEYEEDYKSILYRIKNVDNKEIRCNLYNKYVNSDFGAKDFMHK